MYCLKIRFKDGSGRLLTGLTWEDIKRIARNEIPYDSDRVTLVTVYGRNDPSANNLDHRDIWRDSWSDDRKKNELRGL